MTKEEVEKKVKNAFICLFIRFIFWPLLIVSAILFIDAAFAQKKLTGKSFFETFSEKIDDYESKDPVNYNEIKIKTIKEERCPCCGGLLEDSSKCPYCGTKVK